MKKLILILLTLLFLISCSSTEYVYVYPELPEFNPTKPEAPILEELPEGDFNDMFYVIIKNDLKRDTYIAQLEAYGNIWEDFYTEVYNTFKEKQEN